jgi:hypothetical protein
VLARGGQLQVGEIRNVELVGGSGKLNWKQEAGGLKVEVPAGSASEHAIALRIRGV